MSPGPNVNDAPQLPALTEATARNFTMRDVSDPMTEFFHDVAPEVTAEAFTRGERAQSGTPFEKPWPLAAWPEVPTRFLLCREDRFLPAGFMRRVARERLGIAPDETDGGHLPALHHPKVLADRLESYRTAL